MFLATLLMMGPVVDRVGTPLGIDPLLPPVILWNALFLSLFVYDWTTLRRIHRITYLGFIWFYFVWAIAVFT